MAAEPDSRRRCDCQEGMVEQVGEEGYPDLSYIIQSYDTAFSKKESADYSAITTWGIFQPEEGGADHIILLDAQRGRWNFPELKMTALEEYNYWEPDMVIVEAKATGTPLTDELRRGGIPVLNYTPSKGRDKVSRMHMVAPLFEAGMVWAPEKSFSEEVIEECAAFPHGDHDDYVDSMTMAFIRFRQGGFISLDGEEEDEWYPRKREYYMAETPIGQGGPEGIELPKVEVDVNTPEDFEGGVDVTDDGQGGAILQSLEGMEVETEVYDHNANLADVLDEQTLGELSSDLIAQYEEDSNSRDEWEEGYVKGLDLLGIKYEERTQPFAGASGVTHPLIAESVTDFQAQCYKELLPAGGGKNTDYRNERPGTRKQATRVKDFMNYQITEVMEEFDTDTDQMLFYLPLSGSTFKKVYYDPLKQRAVSMFVPAEDMVIPYSATDLQHQAV